MITRTDRHRHYDADGNLISELVERVDVTAEVVEWDLHGKLRDLLTETRGQLQDRRTHRAELAAEIAAIDSEITAAETARHEAVLRRQRRALVAAQRVERDTAEALRACRMLTRLVLGALDDTEEPD